MAEEVGTPLVLVYTAHLGGSWEMLVNHEYTADEVAAMPLLDITEVVPFGTLRRTYRA